MTSKSRHILLAGTLAGGLALGCQAPPVATDAPARGGAYQVLAEPSLCPAPPTPRPSASPSWPPSSTSSCEPYVDPPGVTRITTGTTTYSSTLQGAEHDVFAPDSTYCERWNNGAGGSAVVTRTFGAFYPVRHVRIDMAIGDIRFSSTSYRLELHMADGWQVIETLADTGIGSTFPNYRRTLDSPVRADAFRLTMTGNGWFNGYGFAVYQ